MAAPVTHIVLADQYLRQHPNTYTRDEFLLGTSFPDIRYLGHVAREETHIETPTLSDLHPTDSFRAGMQLHAWIDIERERRIEKGGIYNQLPITNFKVDTLKFVEDYVLYPTLLGWESIRALFSTILPEELTFSMPEDRIRYWHTLASAYLEHRPDEHSGTNLLRAVGFTEERLQGRSEAFSAVIARPDFLEAVSAYLTFDFS